MSWITGTLVIAGLFFVGVGAVGIIRMPDFYSRAHAAGKTDTLGGMLILAGLAIHNGLELNSLKLLLVLVFVALANPAAVHALTRAGLRSGQTPLMYGGDDEHEGDSDWKPVTPQAPLAGPQEPTGDQP